METNIDINGGHAQVNPAATQAIQNNYYYGQPAPSAEPAAAGTVANNHIIVIRLTLTLQINGEFLEKSCRALKEKFNVAWKKLRETHFEGEGQPDVPVYQFSGTPQNIALALRYIREEWDEDALSSVRYISKERHFDRSRLTLVQAIGLAEDESKSLNE